MPAGRIFAIGGMNGQRQRLMSVEALDPREGQWHCLPTISSPRSVSASESCNILHERAYYERARCIQDFETPAPQALAGLRPNTKHANGYFADAQPLY